VILLSSSLLLLSACGTVKLKDGQACADLGPRGGATCDNVFTDKPIDHTPAEWDRLRIGRISIPASLYANWKKALLKFCKDTGRCKIEEEEAIEEMGKKLNRLNLRGMDMMDLMGIEE